MRCRPLPRPRTRVRGLGQSAMLRLKLCNRRHSFVAVFVQNEKTAAIGQHDRHVAREARPLVPPCLARLVFRILAIARPESLDLVRVVAGSVLPAPRQAAP